MQYIVKVRVTETNGGKRHHYKAGSIMAINRAHAEQLADTLMTMHTSKDVSQHAMVFARVHLPYAGNIDIPPENLKDVADAIYAAVTDAKT